MKHLITIVFIIFFQLLSFAQHQLFYMKFPENAYYVPKTRQPQTVGTPDLFNQPRQGFLILENGDTLRDLALQYNSTSESILASDLMQKSTTPSTYKLSIEKVKYLNAPPSVLFNPQSAGFKASEQNDKITGLVELNYFSQKANFIIGRYYYSRLERANYNPIFETGSKDNKIITYSKRYLFYHGTYYELPTAKPKFRKLIEDELNLVINRKINTRDDDDIIAFLNTCLN